MFVFDSLSSAVHYLIQSHGSDRHLLTAVGLFPEAEASNSRKCVMRWHRGRLRMCEFSSPFLELFGIIARPACTMENIYHALYIKQSWCFFY